MRHFLCSPKSCKSMVPVETRVQNKSQTRSLKPSACKITQAIPLSFATSLLNILCSKAHSTSLGQNALAACHKYSVSLVFCELRSSMNFPTFVNSLRKNALLSRTDLYSMSFDARSSLRVLRMGRNFRCDFR